MEVPYRKLGTKLLKYKHFILSPSEFNIDHSSKTTAATVNDCMTRVTGDVFDSCAGVVIQDDSLGPFGVRRDGRPADVGTPEARWDLN